jgi:hypothetical protein
VFVEHNARRRARETSRDFPLSRFAPESFRVTGDASSVTIIRTGFTLAIVDAIFIEAVDGTAPLTVQQGEETWARRKADNLFL